MLRYAIGSTRLYQGDCRGLLGQVVIDMGRADCIIADPPYGDTALTWDREVAGWLELARDWLKPTGSLWLFGSLGSMLRLATTGELAPWRVVQEVVWEKHNGSGLLADRFRRVHELAVQLIPSGAKWGEVYRDPQFTADATKRTIRKKAKPAHHIGAVGGTVYTSHDGGPRLMRSVIRCRSEHGRAVHPTQKPLGIIRPLLEYSTPPGGLVIDPFAGSGTTLVVAQETGRAVVGCELDPTYCDAAIDRLAQGSLTLA